MQEPIKIGRRGFLKGTVAAAVLSLIGVKPINRSICRLYIFDGNEWSEIKPSPMDPSKMWKCERIDLG